GLPRLRRRAQAPHDVRALRGAGGRLLRVDRDAPAPSAEPRRPSGCDGLPRRARQGIAQVEAGAAAPHPSPAPDVTRRPARALSRWLFPWALISLLLLSFGAARAQTPTLQPPPP